MFLIHKMCLDAQSLFFFRTHLQSAPSVWLLLGWLFGWLAGRIGCSGTPAPLAFVGLWVAPFPASHRGLHNKPLACLPVESRINTEQASVTRSIHTHISAALLAASRRCRFLGTSLPLLSSSCLSRSHTLYYLRQTDWLMHHRSKHYHRFTGLCLNNIVFLGCTDASILF